MFDELPVLGAATVEGRGVEYYYNTGLYNNNNNNNKEPLKHLNGFLVLLLYHHFPVSNSNYNRILVVLVVLNKEKC